MARRIPLTQKVLRGLSLAAAQMDADLRDDLSAKQEDDFQAAIRWLSDRGHFRKVR